MNRRSAVWLALATAILTVAQAMPAVAQEERRHRDWTLRCDVMAETHQRVCWIYNDATEQQAGLTEPQSVSVSVGFVDDAEVPVVHFHICPPSAPPGAVLNVNVDNELVADLEIADASGVDCQYARSSDESEDILTAFRRGIVGQFQMIGPDGFDVTIPLSLLGFSSALRGLENIFRNE